MNPDTDEDKLGKAQVVIAYLGQLFNDKSRLTQEEFDKACELYAKAIIVRARITSKGEAV